MGIASLLMPKVVKVTLKEDENISHDLFKHDMDKAAVTGAVFSQMQIQDDPLDDDIMVRCRNSTPRLAQLWSNDWNPCFA